ncbi:ABC transporter permease [Arthrobacter sp. SD76]|uniref:ABC transporter permease n=1 Tax=Arthrobacter sp. SD76 TaxID=3415007 RepID=UPI003C764A36
MEWLDTFLSSGVRVTIPILLGTIACLPTLWTRDINIGLEGVMVFGAFTGVVFGLHFRSALIALICTFILAALCGLLFGLLVTKFTLDVFIGGLVLLIFSGAATVYLMDALFGVKGTIADPATPALPAVTIPFVEDVPVLSGLLSGNSVLAWMAAACAVGIVVLERRSVSVKYMKAAGSNPDALASAGISVTKSRVAAQIWCFALCGAAGVQLSLGQLQLFTDGMGAGVGFVALAAALFSQGRASVAIAVAVGFGFAIALTYQMNEQMMSGELTKVMPYAAALIGMIVVARMKARSARLKAGVPHEDDNQASMQHAL